MESITKCPFLECELGGEAIIDIPEELKYHIKGRERQGFVDAHSSKATSFCQVWWFYRLIYFSLFHLILLCYMNLRQKNRIWVVSLVWMELLNLPKGPKIPICECLLVNEKTHYSARLNANTNGPVNHMDRKIVLRTDICSRDYKLAHSLHTHIDWHSGLGTLNCNWSLRRWHTLF